MTENRQRLADNYLPTKGRKANMVAAARHFARSVAYGVPMIRRIMEKNTLEPMRAAAHWDRLLSQTNFSTYLGGTIGVDASNLLAATLIKYHAPPSPSVLDVGCAGGTLVSVLPPFSRYLGMDVSAHAIGVARADPELAPLIAGGSVFFEAVDVREYRSEQTWDVMVFNEVLYYLRTDQAIAEVERYAKFLNPAGILCVSMKNDPKSHVIFRSLATRYLWLDGMLWQRKPTKPGYAITIDRESPGCLLGVFRIVPAS